MVGLNPLRGFLSSGGMPVGGAGFNNLAAGNKNYLGQHAPNVGAVSAAGQRGYTAREQKNTMYRNALQRRIGGV